MSKNKVYESVTRLGLASEYNLVNVAITAFSFGVIARMVKNKFDDWHTSRDDAYGPKEMEDDHAAWRKKMEEDHSALRKKMEEEVAALRKEIEKK